jgi:tetratricopeptide (TPR) repeat protein
MMRSAFVDAEQEPRNGRPFSRLRQLSWGKQIPVKMCIVAVAAALALAGARPAWAESALEENLLSIAQGWDRASFEIVDPRAQLAAFRSLERQAKALTQRYPHQAAPLVWQGVIVSTEAGVVRGMAGFRLVKRARDLFERAAKINPEPQTSALLFSNLGELYYRVPGFPIGFGDNDKATDCFKKALAAAPNNIGVNVRYAGFLAHERRFEEARQALKLALQVPIRPGREVGDKGFKHEAQALLADIDKRTAR